MTSYATDSITGGVRQPLVTLNRDDYEALLDSNTSLNNTLAKVEEQMKGYHKDTNDTLNQAASTIRSLRQHQITAYIVGATSTICGIFMGAMLTYLYMRNHQ